MAVIKSGSSTDQAFVTPAQALKVDGSAATQPVSGSVTANIGTTNGLALNSTLTGGTQTTQITDGTETAQISPSGALSVDINAIGANALGQELMAASIPVVIASNQNPLSILQQPAPLAVTATAATGVAVTLTLPAVASQFHYITLIEIVAYTTVARTGTATPIVVTSTNLPGVVAWTFSTAAAIGTTDTKLYTPTAPLKSSVVNTATTIVCPATTSVIWRVNIFYYSAT